jgi:release factor glutamine methyltransferase
VTRERLVAALRAAGCVFAEEEAALLLEAAPDAARLDELARRRVGGEPLEYVLGWAEFAGLRLAVTPGVFVPRRRTELVLAVALRRLAPAPAGGAPGRAVNAGRPRVLELCCGAAPVASAIAERMPRAEVHASDIDPDAVAVARRNLEPRGGAVHEGDLFAPLPGQLRAGFDVIVANAPYVPTAEIAHMPAEAREHEHRVALDGGPDGLAVHRRVAREAAAWLAPGGTVVVETSRLQASVDRELFAAAGWRAEIVRDEERAGTAVVATR